MYDILGVRPQVFIAPYGAVNNYTFVAAEENSIKYVSANTTYDMPPYNIKDQLNVYHLPQITLTGDLNSDNTEWIGFNHGKVLDEIEHGLSDYGFAVVTMHPQEYTVRDKFNYQNKVNSSQINELQLLLDGINKEGIKIVKISEIVSTAQELSSNNETTIAAQITRFTSERKN